jgi:hypothetical protein
MQEALVAPSFITQQKVLELVVDRIVVENTKLTIRHIVPTGPVRLRTEPQVTTTPTRADSRSRDGSIVEPRRSQYSIGHPQSGCACCQPGCGRGVEALCEWSLEDITEGFQGNHFSSVLCLEARENSGRLLSNSGRLDQLPRMVIRDGGYRDQLPSFPPGLVQDNDEFSRVQVAGKDSVFPLLHHPSMTDLLRF